MSTAGKGSKALAATLALCLPTLAIAAGAAPALGPCCTREVKVLKLPKAEWQCLMSKLSTLRKNTKIWPVFPSLTQEYCKGGGRTTLDLPPVAKSSRPAGLILSRDQIDCLAKDGMKLKPVDGQFVYDLAKCTASGRS